MATVPIHVPDAFAASDGVVEARAQHAESRLRRVASAVGNALGQVLSPHHAEVHDRASEWFGHANHRNPEAYSEDLSHLG